MPPTKEAQVAEARAREAAHINPAENAHAAEPSDIDGARGDLTGARTEPAPQRAAGEQPQKPPTYSAFDKKRADIINRFRGDRGQQEDDVRDEISDFQRTGMPVDFEPQAVEPEPEPAPQETATEDEQQGEPVRTVKVKVHGVEKDVTLDELVVHAQKAMAAENVLEEAKTKAREIDNLLSEARNKVARVDRPDTNQVRQPNTQTAEGHPEAGETPENQPDALHQLIEALQFGTPEEARERLGKTIQEQVAAGVQQQLKAQRFQDEGARANKVLKEFEGKHADIAADPMARAAIEAAILDQQVKDIVALGVDLKQIRPDGMDPTPGDISVAHRWYRAEGFSVTAPETMLENATKKFVEWRGQKEEQQPAPAPVPPKTTPRIEVSVERTERRAAPPQPQRPAAPRPAPAATAQPRDRSAIVQEEMARRLKPRGRVGISA